jgi:chitin disaccharide deacetylase
LLRSWAAYTGNRLARFPPCEIAVQRLPGISRLERGGIDRERVICSDRDLQSACRATPAQRETAIKNLIVTADDFGVAPEVNEAVERGHRDGIITAASLMVTGPVVADAVERARRMPSLRVGLHLVLVDGVPALPRNSVPNLSESSGRFRPNMTLSGINMMFSRPAQHQLAAEITAQFEAFRATGLTLDHVNAHKHFHVHPLIAKCVLRIGRQFGVRAVRVPIEPADLLRRIQPGAAVRHEWLLSYFARGLLRRARGLGIFAPDQVFGVRWSGAMTRDRMRALIEGLPEGVSEIYCHPGLSGGFAGSARGYRYADELAAVTDADVVAAARSTRVRLGGFLDFAPCRQERL